MRKLLLVSVTAVLLVILFATYHLWHNNRSIEAPSVSSISASFEKGVGWLLNNREAILGNNNSMLWWFIQESADITQDERLLVLFHEYKRRHLDPYPSNIWRHLFDDQSKTPIILRQLEYFPDYNLHFIYGVTCSPDLEREEIIRRQNEPEFCANYHPFSPACVTHQLMGARFAQRRGCLDPQVAQELVHALQKKVIRQLVWDPRVVDVYIQRVLVMAESGMLKELKPVWLQRVLDAQLDDGGWSNFYFLFPVSHMHSIGFKGHQLVLQNPEEIKGSFHATAQGVFLMSLVASEWNKENTLKNKSAPSVTEGALDDNSGT
jgi:hypothetical protein